MPPVVNQFEFHVGMGPDPNGIVSASVAAKIVPQAYSALGDGKLIGDPLLVAIGKCRTWILLDRERGLVDGGTPLPPP